MKNNHVLDAKILVEEYIKKYLKDLPAYFEISPESIEVDDINCVTVIVKIFIKNTNTKLSLITKVLNNTIYTYDETLGIHWISELILHRIFHQLLSEKIFAEDEKSGAFCFLHALTEKILKLTMELNNGG